MKLLIALFAVFAFLASPVVAAQESGVVHLVAKKKKSDVQKRWHWCQKRLDKGYTWDKKAKRCREPKK